MIGWLGKEEIAESERRYDDGTDSRSRRVLGDSPIYVQLKFITRFAKAATLLVNKNNEVINLKYSDP